MKRIFALLFLGILAFFVYVQPVSAQEPLKNKVKRWGATAESGIVVSTGNTETKTLSLKTYAKYEPEKCLHELKLEKLFGSSAGKAQADIFTAYQKSAYKMSAMNLLFENLKYSKDRFNGFDYEFNAIFGYERKFMDTDVIKFGLAVGPSYYRFSRLGTPEDNLTASANLPFLWNIRPDLVFNQDLNFIFGDSHVGIISESVSGLKVKLIGNLALKNSFTVKNKSKVPAGIKRTDTITEVTLIMDF